MKKIIFPFLFVIFIFYIFIFHLGKASAQSSNYFLSVVPYQTREDLDVLFAQSSRVIDYLEGEGVEEPIFLSIITEPQRQNLTNQDFKIKILDRLNNLNDIANYTLLYHPQPNQSKLLTNLGKIFIVSQHYTMLKTSSEKPFVYEGTAAKFFVIPFSKQVVTPPYRTKTIVPSKPASLPIIPVKKPSLIKTIFISFFLSLIIAGAIYLFFQQRKKKLPITTIVALLIGLVLIFSLLISKLTTKENYPTNDLEIGSDTEL